MDAVLASCPAPVTILLSVRFGQVSLKPLVMLKRNHMDGGVNTDIYHQKIKVIDESYLSVQTVWPGILMPRLCKVPFSSCGRVSLSLFSVWTLETEGQKESTKVIVLFASWRRTEGPF